MMALWAWLAINWFSLLQTVSIVTGLVVVAKQQHDGNRQAVQNRIQRDSQSIRQLYQDHRELIGLGFSNPELLKILEDENIANPLLQKRYLQLWLNQLANIHDVLQHTGVRPELHDELWRNLVDCMSMNNMQRHWQEYGMFYAESFQVAVNEILKKLGPPENTAQAVVESSQETST